MLIINALECSQECIWRIRIKEISRRGKKEVLKLTLFSHVRGRLSDTSMLTDKGEHHCPIYLHSQQTDCSSECVWTGKAKRRSRLFSCKWIQCLLCAGRMRECSLCVKALYMPDCQTPCIEIDRLSNDHHYVKCPFLLHCSLWWWI